ncbi:MAG: enoyl-CoA hydratase/isomerase family protein [Candidatus Omnitrophica bacterium]|nr:enoyl-CoA hydratase/isomerase family protein [Candidatus Omnitrophota bacterium]
MSEAIAGGVDHEIITTKRIDTVKWIRFNRPEVRNAISREGADRLREELEGSVDEGARIVILTGRGGAFCSGADLKANGLEPGKTDQLTDILEEHYHPMLMAIAELPIPVIAAVDGVAAGIGSDIALACDIRLASDTAVFIELFINVGLIPDGGGTFTLPRLIGMGRAMEMALSGQGIKADQALEWGLVNQVYPADNFKRHVQAYAEKFTFKPPLAVERTKRAIREACAEGSFHDALKRESRLQKELFTSQDFMEGVSAFREKRSPHFRGR